MLKVDHVSRMSEMDNDESVEHFSWHEFKQPIPKEDFVELSRDVVAYCGGLPLALEVIARKRKPDRTSRSDRLNSELDPLPVRSTLKLDGSKNRSKTSEPHESEAVHRSGGSIEKRKERVMRDER